MNGSTLIRGRTFSLAKVRNGPTNDEGYSFDRSRGLFTPR
jgi:hypothetical protein